MLELLNDMCVNMFEAAKNKIEEVSFGSPMSEVYFKLNLALKMNIPTYSLAGARS